MIRMRASSDSALAISTSCCSPTRSVPTARVGVEARCPSRLEQLRAAPRLRAGDRRSSPAISASRGRERCCRRRVSSGHQVQLLVDDGDAGRLGVAALGEAHRRAVERGSRRRSRDRCRRGSSSASTCRRRSRPSAHGSRPAATAKSTLRRAATPPNRFDTPRASSTGAPSAANVPGSWRRAWQCRPPSDPSVCISPKANLNVSNVSSCGSPALPARVMHNVAQNWAKTLRSSKEQPRNDLNGRQAVGKGHEVRERPRCWTWPKRRAFRWRPSRR